MIDVGHQLLFGPEGVVIGVLLLVAILAELTPYLILAWIAWVIIHRGPK